MTNELRKKLETLLEQIQLYQQQVQVVDRNSEKAKNYIQHFYKLKRLFLIIKKVLKEQESSPNCDAYVSLIEPYTDYISLPKCNVRLQVQTIWLSNMGIP